MIKLLFSASIIIIFGAVTTFTQSRLIVQLNAGYLLPLPDFSGDIPPSAGDNNYQMKSGIHFGAIGKYSIDKKSMFRVTASLNYNMCSNSGNVAGYTNSLETHKINIFTAGAGAEFAYISKWKVVPFLGAEFTYNLFSGKNEYEIGDTLYYTINLSGESRFGMLVNGGADIRIEKDMGILIGVKYNIANLIGKKSTPSSTEYKLNDAGYSINGKSVTAKNIQYLQFYAGLSFYFMQPPKRRN